MSEPVITSVKNTDRTIDVVTGDGSSAHILELYTDDGGIGDKTTFRDPDGNPTTDDSYQAVQLYNEWHPQLQSIPIDSISGITNYVADTLRSSDEYHPEQAPTSAVALLAQSIAGLGAEAVAFEQIAESQALTIAAAS